MARAAPLLRTEARAPVLDHALSDGVLRLTLARPERRNPLSEDVLAALSSAIAEAGRNKAVRVIVISARGPAFSAGHDLAEMTARRADADGGKKYFERLMKTCSSF